MTSPTQKPIVLALTGASGAIYGVRLLNVLLAAGQDVHITLSPAAVQVFQQELGVQIDLKQFDPRLLLAPGNLPAETAGEKRRGRLTYHHYQDYGAGIASGSFLTAGMVVCPCSMGTVGALAAGLSTNLIHRAADVHLKERRKLIIVPRETPLGSISLQNLKVLADAGVVVLPAMPGFYHRPTSISDLVDFVVSRVCDQLGVVPGFARRWGTDPETAINSVTE